VGTRADTCSEFKNSYFTEVCSGSEEGSYLRLIDCVYHSTLGLIVIKKKGRGQTPSRRRAPIATRIKPVSVGSNRLFQVLHLYWRSPESSDPWYKSRHLKKAI